MNLENTVIKVITPTHGRKVINWFKEQGVDIPSEYLRKDYIFSTVRDCDRYIYYGLRGGGFFENWSYNDVIKFNLEVIELPKNTISEPILNVLL